MTSYSQISDNFSSHSQIKNTSFRTCPNYMNGRMVVKHEKQKSKVQFSIDHYNSSIDSKNEISSGLFTTINVSNTTISDEFRRSAKAKVTHKKNLFGKFNKYFAKRNENEKQKIPLKVQSIRYTENMREKKNNEVIPLIVSKKINLEIDLDNPLNLDFVCENNRITHKNDAHNIRSDIVNMHNVRKIKRKRIIKDSCKTIMKKEFDDYNSLPKIYDCDIEFDNTRQNVEKDNLEKTDGDAIMNGMMENEENKCVKLVRTGNKLKNMKKIQIENERRKSRILKLTELKLKQQQQKEEILKENHQKEEKNKVLASAASEFKKILNKGLPNQGNDHLKKFPKSVAATDTTQITHSHSQKEPNHMECGDSILNNFGNEKTTRPLYQDLEVKGVPINIEEIFNSSKKQRDELDLSLSELSTFFDESEPEPEHTKAVRPIRNNSKSSKMEPTNLKIVQSKKTIIKNFHIFNYLFPAPEDTESNKFVVPDKKKIEQTKKSKCQKSFETQQNRSKKNFVEIPNHLKKYTRISENYSRNPILKEEIKSDSNNNKNVSEDRQTTSGNNPKIYHSRFKFETRKPYIMRYIPKVPMFKSIEPDTVNFMKTPSLNSKILQQNNCNKSKKYFSTIKKDSMEQLNQLQKSKKIRTKSNLKDSDLDYPEKEYLLAIINQIIAGFETEDITYEQQTIDENNNAGVQNIKSENIQVQSILSDDINSLTNSTCTNFSKDSTGSFVLLKAYNEQKLRLDFIRKPSVPYEEFDHSLVKASIKNTDQNQSQPFQILPYAGHVKELKQKQNPIFNFQTKFTFQIPRIMKLPFQFPLYELPNDQENTNILKTDLQVYKETALEFRCSPKYVIPVLRNALHKKIGMLFSQDKIYENEQIEKRQHENIKNILELKESCEKLMVKWREDVTRKSFDKICSIESYYSETSILKKELENIKRYFRLVTLNIIFLENDWVYRTILQNFQYLIMKNSWREKYDWIHRNDKNELESYAESIRKRNTVNIRKRDRDDAWAIKEFYENVYLPNKKPILIVFQDATAFIMGIRKLRIRTFISLLEMHYAMHDLMDLEHNIDNFKKSSKKFLELRTIYVNRKVSKKYFMTERAKKLQEYIEELDEPLRNSFSDKGLRNIQALTDVVYEYVMPANIKNDATKSTDSFIDKLKDIFNLVYNLLEKIDRLPNNEREKKEKKYRKELASMQRQSHKAVLIENRIQANFNEVKRNLLPPFKKPPHV